MERGFKPETPDALLFKDKWGTESTEDNRPKTNYETCTEICLYLYKSVPTCSPRKIFSSESELLSAVENGRIRDKSRLPRWTAIH